MTVVAPFYVTCPTLTKDNWRDKAAAKRAARDELIPLDWRLPQELVARDPAKGVMEVPKTCRILTERELEITELDEVEELASRIASKRYTAVEVTTAFCKRAAIAHQLVNCLTEIMFDRALQRAHELDEHLVMTGKTVGPLHGVPVSLKEQFDIAGVELTMGYASYLNRISPRNSSLAQLLLDAGAVLYVRTNVPQTMMISDSFNWVFGRTVNPYRRSLVSGGSSGGEGALIAMKGSILGVGTDIGGSIRIPSSFCGLCGLRPSTRRVPYGLATNSMMGQESVPSVAGPLSRSFRSSAYFMKTVFDANASDYDATALPFAFNQPTYTAALTKPKLVFGLMKHDYNVTPTPPVQRALRLTVEKLKAAGHEVIEFDGTVIKDTRALLDIIFRSDGGEDIRRVREAIGEPLIPLLTFDDPTTVKTVYETWQLNREKERFQQAFLDQWLATSASTSTGKPIDALLLPCTPTPAYVPGTALSFTYTGPFNLLDLPAAAVPVTKVDPLLDQPDPAFVSMGPKDQQTYDSYSAEVTAGLPVSVQLVGRRWQEEELLGIAARVTDLIAFYTPPSDLTADNWRARAAAKRAARDALIPVEWRLSDDVLMRPPLDATKVVHECGILTERELEITELDDLEELASRITHRVYTSVEVTTAYCNRAAIAHQLTNCLTEIFFEEALARAAELDEHLRTTGQPVGSLHGVPISLKDQFDVAGTECTMGYAAYLGRISTRNSTLVQLLLDAGAVLHCRTNVPQTLLDGDTENHVFGRTWNPLNITLSPGGSSGGEGALVAMKGSILGVGTDIGGSIRIPASFCGLYGLRPSSNRVPYGFATNSLMGQQTVISVAGPMARSFSSCTHFLRVVLDAQPGNYDATALPFPFDASATLRIASRPRLSFGVIRSDHHVTPHPPVQRALEESVAKLRAAGHEVIEFDIADFTGISPLLSAIFFADGIEDIHRTLHPISEPLLPHLTFSPSHRKTVYESWQLNRQRETFQQAFLDRWLATASLTSTGRPVDALLAPTTAMTACKPGDMLWGGYGAIASLLDLPAACMPVGTVDPDADVKKPDFVPLTKADEDVWATYDPEATAGMPTSIQIIGRRWKDEELLAVCERVAAVLSPSSTPTGSSSPSTPSSA
ncbi:hypothetical protein JCM8097_007971 [Rhodosporidiobolus ruineniae]